MGNGHKVRSQGWNFQNPPKNHTFYNLIKIYIDVLLSLSIKRNVCCMLCPFAIYNHRKSVSEPKVSEPCPNGLRTVQMAYLSIEITKSGCYVHLPYMIIGSLLSNPKGQWSMSKWQKKCPNGIFKYSKRKEDQGILILDTSPRHI